MRGQPKYDENGRPIKEGLFDNSFSNKNEDKYKMKKTYSYKERKIHNEVKEVENYKRNISSKYDILDKKFYEQNPAPSLEVQTEELKKMYVPIILAVLTFFFMPFGIFVAIYILSHYRKDKLKRDLYQTEKLARGIAKFSIAIAIIYGFVMFYGFSHLFV